jgi:hypothetical protein
MDTGLRTLDRELEKQLKQIESLEMELFFKRVRLAGLKSVKDSLLRESVIKHRKVDDGREAKSG